MEIFKLDKSIDNDKLDLEMVIAQLKKEKDQLSQSLLSQSLQRRKYLAIKMNDHLHIEERIEELHLGSSSDEANEAIK